MLKPHGHLRVNLALKSLRELGRIETHVLTSFGADRILMPNDRPVVRVHLVLSPRLEGFVGKCIRGLGPGLELLLLLSWVGLVHVDREGVVLVRRVLDLKVDRFVLLVPSDLGTVVGLAFCADLFGAVFDPED